MSQELINKINLVIASRYYLKNNIVSEHFPLSVEKTEMDAILQSMLFKFIKHKFTGCKIRVGAEVISIRLDDEIHRKARKITEAVLDNQDWKEWFLEKQASIINRIQSNASAFKSSNYVRYEVVEDHHYIHVPFLSRKIYDFNVHGVIQLINWMDNEYKKNVYLSSLYNQVTKLITDEVAARNEMRRMRTETERNNYLSGLRSRLMRPINLGDFDRSSINAEDKFKAKMFDWCINNGITPSYAEAITNEIMLPVGTNVRVVVKDGERDDQWYAVPMFGEYEIPEGYVLRDRWARVTDSNSKEKRARDGLAPIVLEGFVYTSFDLRFWAHTIPAEYEALRAQTLLMRQEAQVEAVEAKKAYDAEQELQRQRQEEERKARLEQEASELRSKLEQLRSQDPVEVSPIVPLEAPATKKPTLEEVLGKTKISKTYTHYDQQTLGAPAESSSEEVTRIQALSESIKAQLDRKGEDVRAQIATLVHSAQVYCNGKGLPIERYVAVSAQGEKRFFREKEDALAHMMYRYGIPRGDLEYVYDYWNPSERVEIL